MHHRAPSSNVPPSKKKPPTIASADNEKGSHHRVEDAEKNNFGPGSFGFHELVDRSSVVMDTWASHVQDHPSCQRNPHLKKLADQVMQLMFDFYQASAFEDTKDDPEVGGSAWCREYVEQHDSRKRLDSVDEDQKEDDEWYETPFMKRFMDGQIDMDQIDGYVDAWHRGGKKATLREHLGFSEDEYKQWAENPYEFEDKLEEGRKKNDPA